MTAFDDRKNASEKKFVMDAQKEFKAEARRNKKIAHWAAELLGKTGDDVGKYVTEVIVADMEEAGDDDVFRKVRGDFDAAGVEITDTVIRTKMDALMDEAREEIYGED